MIVLHDTELAIFFCFPEIMANAIDVNDQGSTLVQIKEEEEDTNKQPAVKRKRGQSKSQTKSEEPKEEIKIEGNLDLLVISVVLVMHTINMRWDDKRNCSPMQQLLPM